MFTEHLTEVEPGIFIREDATPAKSNAVAEHYEKQAISILDADRYHYECMARKFADAPIFAREFYNVADIAGGHPKLASFMRISGDVTVYDQYAEMYERLNDEFIKRYPMATPVTYCKKSVTHPNFSPDAELAILSHILEHLTVKQIRKMLANLDTDKIIVYGPNVARARNSRWFHFRPGDHRTFATIGAMQNLVAESGFTVEWAVEYHEDYIIYGDKK